VAGGIVVNVNHGALIGVRERVDFRGSGSGGACGPNPATQRDVGADPLWPTRTVGLSRARRGARQPRL